MARTDWFTYCRSFARRQNSKRKAVAQSPRKSRGFQFESLERRMLLAADVFANKLDYAPGETAHIFASDFAVGETVQFQVLHNDGTPNTGGGHEPWQVTDGVRGDFNNDGIMDGDLDGVADGNIQTTWYVNPDDSLDSAFDLTALGLSSGLSAFTTFTDGNPAVDVQQWENLTAQWANGQANANQAKYLEGDVVPYWMEAENLTVGTTYGVRINLDYYQSTTDAGGFLYLDTYNDSITGVPQNSDDGTGGPLPALSSDNTFTFNDPLYANPGLTFAVYNANVISVAYSTSANGLNRYADVRFTPVAANENDGEATVNIYWGQRLSLPNEVITSANPDANSKGASGFTGGSLQTKVEGTGVAGTTWITPSNAVQLMPGVVVQGSISGYKWNDIDGQGDKDVSEPGLAGWTIELYKDDGDNVFDAGDVLVDTEVTADGQTDANGDGVVNSLDLGFYKYAPVLRGTYFVREVQQAGWSQTYPTDNVNGPLTVSETTSSYTNINFGNRQQGRILVEKQTNPDGSVETFEFDPSYTTNFSLSDNGQNNSGLLAPGSYTVEELAKAGWDLTNIEIVSGDTDNGSTIGGDSDFDAGDKTATIDLDAGEVITVRFTNTQRGRILVEKQTNPDGSVETFEFDPSYAANFSLSDNGQNNSGLLAPASYTVEELAKAGWDLTNIEIVSGDTDNGSTIGGDSDFDAGDKTATIDLDAGEVITVRFTNTQRGRILVEKQTNPDGSVETFEFDPSYAANFSLSDNGQNNSGLLAPGSYTVEELAKAGWDLTNIEIVSGDTDNGSTIGGDSDFDAGDKTATIDLDAGEVITVRFTNTQRGRILVEKQTNPDGSVETFEFDPSYAANFSLSDNGQNNSGLLAPASYTVEELAKAGWDLTNIEIVSGDTDNGSTIGGDSDFDAGDKTATIDLDAGEVITVRFTNTQRGRILVEKQTNPDGSVETFEFDPSYSANFSLSDNGQNNSGLLAPASYTVEELAKAGWDLTNIEIVSGDTDNGSTIGGDSDFDAGDKTATIDLDAGEVITVRFTNTQRGRILVEKQTNPDGSVETFEFDPSYAANFSLSDNGQNNSGLLAPASYTVEELAKAGWDLTNIEIVSGDTDNGSTIGGDSDFDAGDKTATIDLDAGEVITVRFTNTQRGRILVEKQTNPDGSVETFEFDPSYAANFSLSDNGQNNSGLLAPASYTVEELAKAGWDLTNIEIVSGDTDNGSTIGGDSDFDAGDKTATIDLDAGEVITVRFTNTQRGRILVEKQTNPDGSVETFEFDPSYAANFSLSDNGQNNSGLLAPASYTVEELAKAGWDLTNIEIVSGDTDNGSTIGGDSDFDAGDKTATIDLDAGEVITVRFTNTQRGRILVEKQTNPDGSVETFEFDPSYAANFSLSDNGQNNSGLLAPGSYTVEELAKAGWDLTNIEIVSGDTDNGSTIGGDSDFDAGDKTATIDLDAGEVITVRFTNTQRGRILVEKQTNPDGSVETFEFDPSYTTNFSLSDNGQNNSGLLAPGSYTVEELAKAGWDLTNIEIVSGDTDNGSTIGGDSDFDAGDKTATIDLDAGEVITVRFTNTQRGRILVEKQTNPDGSVETFEFDPSYTTNFSLSDNGQNNSGLLAPGSYTVEELAKAGWDLTNIEIVSGDTDNGSTIGGDSDFDAGDKTATIDLDAGEVITVRFTNTQRGRILVEKQTNPDGSVETFEFDPSYTTNFSLSDNGQNNSGLLAPGSYTVEELAKAGWDLTNIEIVSGDTDNGSTIGGDSDFDAGDKTATIDLDAGEVITVRFTNTQRGRILVEKQTNPDGSVETFEFDPSYTTNFSLSDNGQNNSGLLAPGSYTVEELAKAGWDLTNIEIVSGDTDNGSTIGGDSDFDAGDKTATIDLDAGEVITVRFTNTQRGRILVEKQTNPDGSVETFEFDPSYSANFSLSDNGQNNSGLLAPGSYTVEELAKAGWDLTNIEIVSGDTDNGSTIGGDSDFDAGDKTATIDLDAGEVITVRFTNTQRGRILVEKQTNPDGSVETFEFDPSYTTNFSLSDNGQNNSGLLAPGSYTVEELAKAGWDLTNIEIVSGDTDNGSTIGGDSDFDAGDKTATIDLDAGEVITVRFTNTQRGRILVEKQTNPDGSVETFEFDPSYTTNFSLSDNGQNNSGLLAPGSYTVEELAKAGWDLTNIEIVSGDTDNGSTIGGDSDFDAGDKTATIDLDAGEVITVRFTNTQRGRILVEKQTNPDGSVETFEFDPSYSANFSLSDNGQNNSGLLAPASYTVEELAKAGWDLTNIEIVSGDTDNGSTIGGDSDFDAGDKTATIDLDAGEVITVRFTNTQRGRILVEKQTNPDGSVETFEFDPSYSANFSLSDNGQNNSGLLAPASYTVEELAKAGWDLTNIEIVSGDTDNGSTIGGDSDFDAGDKTATIDLDAGEVITVRFTNTQRGRILVEKQTNPDGSVETFEFDPSYSANFSLSDNGQNNSGLLAPASYTVEELAKAGWDLTNIEIVSGDTDNGSTIGGDSDFDAGDKTATIDLDAGEVITVRFTNTQRGRILVEKQTNPDGSVETFEFDPSYAANFSLSDNGQNNSGLLAPASYTVEELAKAGWDLTNIEIVSGDTDNGSTIGGDSDFDAGDKTATIDLDAGEVITVRFTNTKKSDVIVIGPDKGNTSVPIVKIVDRQSGAILSQFYAFESNFLGGVRIATGDMNGDGIDEIIVASGQGRVGEVRVFTQAGVELTQFRTVPYGTKYAGGIEVAVGDVNGDGKNDIVTTLSNGRAEVRVFYNNYNPALPLLDPIANTPNKQFYLYSSSFLGGADVIVADMGTFVNGTTVNATTPDGKGEIVIGNGPGMRSTIYVYDISGTPTVVDTILPLSNSFKGGITLSAARVNADAIPDLIVASGNQGGSTIEIWNGLTNDLNDLRLSAFATFGDSSTKNAPVHATALDTNGDGIADIIAVVQGTNGTSNQIRSFSTGGTSLGTLGGFVGPWNIASLSKVDSNLKPPMQAVSAVDQAFASLIEESLRGKKAKKKKK